MPSPQCPSTDQLRRFLLGTLPGGEDAALLAHLSVCGACNDTLAEHDEATDSLVDHLRRTPVAVAPPDGYDAAWARVQQAAAVPSTSGPNAADARTGRRLRDYLLLEKLGEGGMGTVWKARHDHLDKLVALKLLSARRLADADAVARFQREMKAVGRLEHPNLVRATDAGQHDGTHFLVMEYLAGQDAGKLVERFGKLHVANACEIVRQAAVGLQYAHSSGMVHRDVKPSNLMVTPAGQVKILDLGLARLDDPAHRDREELTGSRQILGTVAYMAPEQADDGRTVDARADIYALGATLLKLLTDEGPRARSDPESVNPPHLEGVPASLVPLLKRLLATDPAERPQTAQEVAAALAPFATGHHLSALVNQPAKSDPTKSRTPDAARGRIETPNRYRGMPGKWIAAAAGAFGLVLAACIVVIVVIQPPSRQRSAGGDETPIEQPGETPMVVTPPVKPAADYALAFDGHDDFVRIPSLSMKGLKQATVECYLRPRRDPKLRQSMVTGDLPLAIAAMTRERDQLIIAYGRPAEGHAVRSFRVCEPDKRIHVAVVWDGQRIRLFVEGDEAPSSHDVALTELLPLEHGMTVGVDVWGRAPEVAGFPHFTGEVDEIRISSVARYDRGFVPPARFEPDEQTIALYHLDEGRGSRIHDDSGNGHHGVIGGAAWVPATRPPKAETAGPSAASQASSNTSTDSPVKSKPPDP